VKSGAISLELVVTYTFSDDGSDADPPVITYGGRKLPVQLAQRLLDWMGAKTQQYLVDQAWEGAADETDDAACDEAREAS